jgi:hypothetical protein
LAKESTTEGGSASSQKAQRKPITIDIPAAEVGRKPGAEGSKNSAQAESSSADATSDLATEAASSGKPQASPAAAERKAAEERKAGAAKPEPVIPSAFATGAAGRSGSAAAASSASRSESPAGPRPASSWPLLLVAVAGAVVAAMVIIALLFSGYLVRPDNAVKTVEAAEIAALKDDVAVLKQAGTSDDVAPLKEELAALQGSVAELAKRPASGAADPAMLKAIQDRLAALESTGGEVTPGADVGPRVDELAKDVAALKGVAPVDTKSLEDSIAKLRQELDALAARADKLPDEARIAAIETKLDQTSRQIASAAALAPAVAADALADALADGRPYAAELAALKTLGADATAIDALAPQAEKGLPTIAALREQFEAAVQSVALASPIPENAGTVDRLLESARGLVAVRPARPTEGADPEAIISRIRGALAAGDLKAALAEWSTLSESIKSATAEWARLADARQKADDLVAEVRSAALAGLVPGQ